MGGVTTIETICSATEEGSTAWTSDENSWSRDRVPPRVQTSFLSASVILGAVESLSVC